MNQVTVEYFCILFYNISMKVAIDCRMIGSGGIGSYISALLPFFINKNECILLGDKKVLEKFINNNVHIVECNIKTFSVKELFFFPKKILTQINNCDVYYTPYCNIPFGINIPIYSTIHDVVFLDIKGLASKTGTFIRKLFYKHAINKSKAIFTVSNFSSEQIKKPIIVTYNAVPNWFYEEETILETKENTVLFVGNIKKHKGLYILIDAFIIAKNHGYKPKLLIVGNAENFRTSDESVFSLIKEAPKNSIEFTGKISDEKLKQLYKTSKLLIQPSFYEGFGMPPLEAMSLGTNALISDIPVFKEIYKDFPVTFFRTGDSIDLAEKLLQLEENNSYSVEYPQIYSFEKTFNIIQNTLETSL